MECKDFYKMNQRNVVSCVNLYPKQSVGEPSIIKDKDKVLKLCRRLKKCTLDDLISFLETDEDIIKTALLYLVNEGFIQEREELIIYMDKHQAKKGHIENKNLNLMIELRTPEETDIIIKGFCLEIPPHKLCELVNLKKSCVCNYYGVFRKMIYDKQFSSLLQLFFEKPQQGRYRKFYEKYAYFYVYNNQVFVCDKLLRASIENNFTKPEIREFKNMYCYLARIESHNINENYMFYRLAEYIWRRNKEYKDLYEDLIKLIA